MNLNAYLTISGFAGLPPEEDKVAELREAAQLVRNQIAEKLFRLEGLDH